MSENTRKAIAKREKSKAKVKPAKAEEAKADGGSKPA